MVPQMSVAETVKEARRAVMELGCKGVFLRPNAIAGRTLNHPAWEPLWDLLEELDTPLVLHEGIAGEHPEVGVERYTRENIFFVHIVSHPFEHMMAMVELVCGGILERHPGLRVFHVEAGCGWLPYWIERMDHHVEIGYLSPGEAEGAPLRLCEASMPGHRRPRGRNSSFSRQCHWG